LLFHFERNITRKIVDLIYEKSGYSVAICNDQGIVSASAPGTWYKKEVQGTRDNCCEQNICVDEKIIGKVVIDGLDRPRSLLTTLLAEIIAILVQGNNDCKDMDTLVNEYEAILNYMPVQILYKDTKNNYLRINKQVEKDLGIPVQGFSGRSAQELFPAFAEQYYRDDVAVITSGKPKLGIVEQVNTINNEIRWGIANKIPRLNNDGSVSGLIALVLDITENKKIEDQRCIWTKIFNCSGQPMSITDSHNKFVAVNQAFCDATGYSESEVIGEDPKILKSGYHDVVLYQKMWGEINEAGFWQGEIWDKRKNGTVYPKWLRIDQVKNSQGTLINYVGTFTDRTERKAAEERIDYLGRYDTLTGLPNRSVLTDKLGVAIKKAIINKNRIGVISIDLDRFKNINDSLGHKIGDEFLKEIAKRLEYCSGEGAITVRFSGDAFIVILPDIHKESEITAIVNKITHEIRQPFVYGQVELMITVSVGISVFPEDGDNPDVLIRNADTAMHQAKDIGRNNYQFFTAVMNESASEHLLLENSLRRAVERKEFILFYQPQIDAKTGEVIGVEALIRWLHPSKNIVSPLEFIPLAEETGLIIPIGEWVLLEACRQQREWMNRGLPPIPISVNISAVQFRDKDFLHRLATAIKNSGIEPGYLDLEVTESIVMEKPELVIEQLKTIKAMGIKLSLDDFGTGFSSLSYLRYFPLDRLKIDQSFVRDLVTVPVTLAIVESIIVLGRNLKLKTIAEGVETAEQLQCLQRLQCDEIQGYYYSKPLSSNDFITWMKDQKT